VGFEKHQQYLKPLDPFGLSPRITAMKTLYRWNVHLHREMDRMELNHIEVCEQASLCFIQQLCKTYDALDIFCRPMLGFACACHFLTCTDFLFFPILCSVKPCAPHPAQSGSIVYDRVCQERNVVKFSSLIVSFVCP